MAALQEAVSDLTRLATTLAGLYFLVGFVLTLVGSQVAGATGSGADRARALQQGLSMVLLLAAAVSVGPLTRALLSHFFHPGLEAPSPLGEAPLVDLWAELAGLVIRVAVGSGAIVLTVSAVQAGLGLQVARLLGLQLTLARAIGNLLTVLAGLALCLSAAAIAQLLLDRILEAG